MTEPPPLDEVFWSRVQIGGPDECWPWLRYKNKYGYGAWTPRQYGYGFLRMHRLAYFLTYGWWPPVVRHYVCNNPPCCNPAHLRAGTQADNIRDMWEQGRGPDNSREKNPRAKLSNEQRAEVVRLHAEGMTQVALAKRYGVARYAIQQILKKGY